MIPHDLGDFVHVFVIMTKLSQQPHTLRTRIMSNVDGRVGLGRRLGLDCQTRLFNVHLCMVVNGQLGRQQIDELRLLLVVFVDQLCQLSLDRCGFCLNRHASI